MPCKKAEGRSEAARHGHRVLRPARHGEQRRRAADAGEHAPTSSRPSRQTGRRWKAHGVLPPSWRSATAEMAPAEQPLTLTAARSISLIPIRKTATAQITEPACSSSVTVKDASNKVIGAGNNKGRITGNVVVSVGAVNYVDRCTETEVNLGRR